MRLFFVFVFVFFFFKIHNLMLIALFPSKYIPLKSIIMVLQSGIKIEQAGMQTQVRGLAYSLLEVILVHNVIGSFEIMK